MLWWPWSRDGIVVDHHEARGGVAHEPLRTRERDRTPRRYTGVVLASSNWGMAIPVHLCHLFRMRLSAAKPLFAAIATSAACTVVLFACGGADEPGGTSLSEDAAVGGELLAMLTATTRR